MKDGCYFPKIGIGPYSFNKLMDFSILFNQLLKNLLSTHTLIYRVIIREK